MYQPDACNELAIYCKEKGYNIWVYTGFTFEKLLEMSVQKPIYREFLENIDVLVDGEFILEQRDLNLLFRGSRNQRLIDVKSSLENNSVVLVNEFASTENKFFEEKRVPMFI